jgi:nucleotide-binding universal stress UspA family protein
VLGASSHRGSAAFWLGRTPRAVVRRAECPVVVVRGDARQDDLRRVVVGIDDSEHAIAALRWAAAEADLHDVTLLVLHAWEYPYQNPDGSSSEARDLTRVDAARVLDHAVELGRDMCGGDVIGELVEVSPVSAILDFVGDGDLLVLGSRGRGAWRTGLFGSTVNRVLDEAAVPVAVVRRDDDGRA